MTDPSQRFINPEEGEKLFGMQLQIFPELLEEVHFLSGGSPGLIKAIIGKMGEAISEEPDQDVTSGLIREVLGVPDDPRGTDEWRETFKEALRQEKEARADSGS